MAADDLPSSVRHAAGDATLELRVLSGAHRDAHCPVHDGATVGSDLACDIILEDADASGYRIHLDEENGVWSISVSSDPAAKRPQHTFNEPMLLGQVAITVARESTPWPEIPAPGAGAVAVTAEDQPDPASLGGEPSLSDESSTLADGEEPGKSLHFPPLPVAAPLRRRDTWPVLLGVAAVVLAILVAIIMVYLHGATDTAQRPADTRLEAGQQSIGQINATLARLGVGSRLHVSMSSEGMVTVSGWVRDDQEERQIASALSQIWPMPALRLSIEAQALKRAQDTLRKFPVKYAARYEGNGRLHVAGIAPDTETRAAALRALAEQVPGMSILGNDIVLQSDVELRLIDRLKAAHLPGASLKWTPDALQVDTSNVDASEQDRLQTILEEFNTMYLNILSWVRPRTIASKPDNSIPFQIRSIVGGPQPFVVLSDGSKLMTGGSYQGYRLLKITDKRLVFDGPHRAIVPR